MISPFSARAQETRDQPKRPAQDRYAVTRRVEVSRHASNRGSAGKEARIDRKASGSNDSTNCGLMSASFGFIHGGAARVTASEIQSRAVVRTPIAASMQPDPRHADRSEQRGGGIKGDLEAMQRHVIRHGRTVGSPAPTSQLTPRSDRKRCPRACIHYSLETNTSSAHIGGLAERARCVCARINTARPLLACPLIR
jgi:hypothetical protein